MELEKKLDNGLYFVLRVDKEKDGVRYKYYATRCSRFFDNIKEAYKAFIKEDKDMHEQLRGEVDRGKREDNVDEEVRVILCSTNFPGVFPDDFVIPREPKELEKYYTVIEWAPFVPESDGDFLKLSVENYDFKGFEDFWV